MKLAISCRLCCGNLCSTSARWSVLRDSGTPPRQTVPQQSLIVNLGTKVFLSGVFLRKSSLYTISDCALKRFLMWEKICSVNLSPYKQQHTTTPLLHLLFSAWGQHVARVLEHVGRGVSCHVGSLAWSYPEALPPGDCSSKRAVTSPVLTGVCVLLCCAAEASLCPMSHEVQS